MPSPFPGMDPYLENPVLFPDLHDRMITYLSEAVQVRLPEPYYAGIASQTWVEVDERFIEPDVNVLRTNGAGPREQGGAGGVALASGTRTQPVIIHVPHDERHHSYVEICTPQDGGRLVTVIEVLSRINKTPGEHARGLYLRKQREILYSHTNLVEIDLLRAGQHTTAVPHPLLVAAVGPFDYHVCMHRFDNLEDFFVYPVRLEDRLPEIAIPLLPGDGDVPLDLQAVFERCYEAGAYRRRIRYTDTTPVPPLRPEQAEWAARQLAEHGLQPSTNP